MIEKNKQGAVLWLTIKHPPANALSTKVLKSLDEAITEAENDESVRAIVLHGEGRFFVAGADIKEFKGAQVKHLQKMVNYCLIRLNNKKPVIAAIHGAALGGGLELAMVCTIRIATEDCKLGLPETNLGLLPAYGGTQRLPKLVGPHKATEMMLTGIPITGVQAHQWGLVNDVAKDESELLEKAGILADTIASKSTVTTSRILDLIQHAASGQSLEEGLKKEAKYFDECFDSEDSKEGITAFLEKRKPVFSNR
ncbi:LOW QUALITY PROTEIN: enoyl-CoA hydratase [Geomicrobium sp. JCM 19055]|nr:LOW QUALITY PROTEIN: enoyl-CoA hydratase [Geomicrobium sp. JCM 19055]